MKILAIVLVGLVATLHVLFGFREMFLWKTPTGKKLLKLTDDQQEHGAVLAKNQGLYNYFLAAGLVWGLLIADPTQALHTQTFFLSCVVVAGIYGAITASKSIIVVQGLPAIAALAAVWVAQA